MNPTDVPDAPIDKLLASLQERAKELNCLYEVEEVLNRSDLPLEHALQSVVEAIPPGWQYPDVCRAMIEYRDMVFTSSDDIKPSEWVQTADISVQDQVVGRVSVWYVDERPREAIGPFLNEEERLIRTIADRLAHGIIFHQLRGIRQEWQEASRQEPDERQSWRGPIELLRRTDPDLHLRVSRKMLNHLCWTGVEGAQELLQETYGRGPAADSASGEVNFPSRGPGLDQGPLSSGKPFELAARSLTDDEIMSLTREWLMEDKASFLPKALHNKRSSLSEIAEAIRRFHHLMADGGSLSQSTLNGMRVSLIRRFLTEQLDFIMIAKEYLVTEDFSELLDRMILSADSQGRLGGKTAGLFLAEKILRRHCTKQPIVGEFKVPRSWYVASEGLMSFIEYNDLEEVLQQKYRDIAQVRQEYPNIVQLFKSSRFMPDLVKGLSMTLDEVGDMPLIVRSSSLLEDRLGAAFSGKYKSLFLGNTGSKQERITALLDAIAEIYASVFGPDPIAYRRERGLLDFHEEMAILIQEVVGRRAGDYFLPAVAGVAFSNNEFRWSSRIRREDGLIRMVPGLGTRAVDRVGDDYPILAVPGRPALRVNTTVDEVVRYAPKKADVINLKTNRFETVDIAELLEECGTDLPGFDKVFSVLKDDILQPPVTLLVDPGRDYLVADMNGLVTTSPFVQRMDAMLKVLQETMKTPVDIEFAWDGEDLYLLQCRPQSYSPEDSPAPIPKDVDPAHVVFSAGRYVSNGWVPEITHIVYVDPERYAGLASRKELLEVGQAISALNKTLPKRQFILMGPGRWGSRGDIKLGVSVTYSDINNTAMLVEIARKTGGYLPDLSFGTHFFQDLVESSIRYLPLYPDDPDGALNERFLLGSANLLSHVLPKFGHLADTIRVIDVPAVTNGRVLQVLLNSDLDEALGLITEPEETHETATPSRGARPQRPTEEYWRWRLKMAEQIASAVDAERFGVVALYIFGSTKNANAGPSSDIDLLVHFRGSPEQRRALLDWLEGWSLALAEMNYLRTGYRTHELLDVHLVTDEDITRRTSFAAKIGAVTDAARELPLGT